MAIAEKNRAATERAIKALERELARIEHEVFPSALAKVGEIAIEHSRQTHTYKNVTGALEASHAFEVVEPGKSAEIVFDNKGQRESESFNSPPNEIHLLLYAGKQYGFYVERLYGFDVLIGTFLFLRREFTKIFGDAVKSRKVG